MVSAEHEALVAALVAAGVRTPVDLPSDDALAAMRAAELAEPPVVVDGVVIESIDRGGVPCLQVTAPGSDARRAVIYFHGGGYLWMTPQSHVAVLVALSDACGAPCVGAHYRRAPEAPFPAAVEDAVAVYRATVDAGVGAGAITLAGDSAGGGLVIATLLAARDDGLPMPGAALCFSPWTDLAVTGSSADTADDPIVGGPALRSMAAAYLHGADATTPLASPLYADLTGLPPMLIQVGTREALLDDARRFATLAVTAGVDVTYIEHADVIHMWIVFGPELPESQRAFELAGAFSRAHAGQSDAGDAGSATTNARGASPR